MNILKLQSITSNIVFFEIYILFKENINTTTNDLNETVLIQNVQLLSSLSFLKKLH